jgi:hypothetical protein
MIAQSGRKLAPPPASSVVVFNQQHSSNSTPTAGAAAAATTVTVSAAVVPPPPQAEPAVGNCSSTGDLPSDAKSSQSDAVMSMSDPTAATGLPKRKYHLASHFRIQAQQGSRQQLYY